MREMKDSRVLWIGEIPADWEIGRVSFFFEAQLGKMLQPRKATDLDTFEYYLCAANLGKNELKLEPLKQMWFSPSEKCAYEVKKGDLMVVEGGDVASCAIIDTDIDTLYFQNSLHRVRPLSGFDVRILKYLLMITKDAGHIDLICNKATIAHFSKEKLLGLPCVVMPIVAQHKIADYLDRNCSKIDAIIARQQQVIEKLKAYKLSVITEAVTKGLNPDVPMKDSGIEWIGTVPSAWRIGQLKYFATVRSGITLGKKYPPKAELIEVPYLRVANVQGEYIDLTDVAHILVLPVEAEKYQLHKGELLMTEGGDRDKLGRGCVWHGEIEPCLHQNHVYAVTTDPQHLSVHFLDYMTTSAVARNYFDYTAKKTTNLASTNATTILQFRFPIPPAEEQLAIVEYLNQICQRTDHVIAQHSVIIDKLTEYKKSLIYEVVTGKREIDADLPQATTVAVISPELLKYMKAVLMVRLIDGLGDHVLGRVQVQKGLYFAETSSNPRLHLETNYARYTHGPFDREIWDYEAIMAENGWIYSTTDEQERTIYRRGEHFSEYRNEYQRLFPGCEKTVQRIIDFVKQFQYTDGVEKVATLFAAWNDFIIDGVISPTDEEIIAEVRNHWTENKGRIKERTWRRSLARLKDAQFIPQGYGKHTVKWQGGQVHG